MKPMHGIEFSRTISLGHVITIVTFLLSAGVAYGAIQSDINEHKWRIQTLERATVELTKSTQRTSEAVWKIREDISAMRERLDRGSK